jgi:heptosyltransferase III
MNRLDLPPRPRILVITLRRLGDVLLATPLIRSLRRAWPQAWIDALSSQTPLEFFRAIPISMAS